MIKRESIREHDMDSIKETNRVSRNLNVIN